ncbi:2'-5' RNA ligase family protein [Nocardia sp. XZ_19_231]|uniref:2'-5' RNA ligase family protein n=1 Tax=Nocardia sp. XZ_19_231 TaxID=2769252 RepID=UPI00188E619A|nr:2'-5' RNA ligase family protein [Nocardia sp. XZ_19_231]
MTGNLDSLRRRPLENGPLGYHWFLTFDHASELHSRTKECQQAIDPAYFKTTPIDGLHLTLDRISRPYTCTFEQRASVAVAAQHACRNLQPFSLSVDRLTNIRGAIGFVISPAAPVMELRDTLRAATISVLPQASLKESTADPHVTIAYPVFESLEEIATAAAATAGSAVHGFDIVTTGATLVSLELRDNSYKWDVIERVELGADT